MGFLLLGIIVFMSVVYAFIRSSRHVGMHRVSGCAPDPNPKTRVRNNKSRSVYVCWPEAPEPGHIYFGWISWFNPVDFLGDPVEICSLSLGGVYA